MFAKAETNMVRVLQVIFGSASNKTQDLFSLCRVVCLRNLDTKIQSYLYKRSSSVNIILVFVGMARLIKEHLFQNNFKINIIYIQH